MPKLTRRTVKLAPARCAAAAHHHSFEWLDAFLFAFGFLQADVDADGIAGAEFGEVFAKHGFLRFSDSSIHGRVSRQTHSGGASSILVNGKYSENGADFLEVLIWEWRHRIARLTTTTDLKCYASDSLKGVHFECAASE